MKRNVLLLLSALFVSLVGTIVVLVVRVMRETPQDLVTLALDIAPGVAQQVKDFRRFKLRDGRLEWEVAAREARIYEGSTGIEIEDVTLRWHLRDGRTVGLSSARGTVTLEDREIRKIELDGAVQMSLADYQVHVERASYDHAEQVIDAPGRVEITGTSLKLRGDGLRVDVQRQQLALLKNVAMDIDPAAKSRGGTHAPL
jgi:LPS export ABC transporter protein LptC